MTWLAALLLVVAVAAVLRLRGGGPALPEPPATPDGVLRLLRDGRTIDAVAMQRRLTGQGLYDAKQAIDRMRDTGVWEGPAAPAAPPDDAAVAALAKDGRLIEAIKLYRETYGGDLASAKDAVDRLAGR